MTPDELQDAIATLQRDMKETMRELGETRRRVLVLEEANAPRPKEPPRFQTGYEPAEGWVSHPIGDTNPPATTTTNADRLRYLGPDGKLHALGER